jgi:hypothetical protein
LASAIVTAGEISNGIFFLVLGIEPRTSLYMLGKCLPTLLFVFSFFFTVCSAEVFVFSFLFSFGSTGV